MLRYALLRHDCPDDYRDGPHWDLMLERPGSGEHRLATWSLLALPTVWATAVGRAAATSDTPIVATQLADHRVAYLDYEGPVGGDRGDVERWAGGPITWIVASERTVRVAFTSPSPLRGALELRNEGDDAWRLHWFGELSC